MSADLLNSIRAKARWNQIKGELKSEYADLTESDLTYIEGKEDELIGNLQERLSKTKDEVMSELKRIADKIADATKYEK